MRWLRDAWILGAVLFLLAGSFTSFFGWDRAGVDAKAYWQAGTQLRLGEPLYAQTAVAALDKPYLYPPAFAAAFAPLTVLPPLWGYAFWMALELLCVLALAHTCAALAGLAPGSTEQRRNALALALAAGVVPVFDNLAEGQVNLLVALLCGRALLDAEQGRDRRGALLLAAGVHIKLLPVILVGAFVLWRRTRFVAWFVVGLVSLALLPLPWRIGTMGVGAGLLAFTGDYAAFWGGILWPAASGSAVAGVEQLFAPNFSLRGTLSRLFVEGVALSPFPALASRRGPLLFALPRVWVDAVATLGGLAGIAAAVWVCRRSATDRAQRVASAGLLLCAGALTAPTFWQHHFVLLGLAGAGLWQVLETRSAVARARVWACAIGLLVGTITIPFFVTVVLGVGGPLLTGLKEYGAPTGAALAFFLVGMIVTSRHESGRAVVRTGSRNR